MEEHPSFTNDAEEITRELGVAVSTTVGPTYVPRIMTARTSQGERPLAGRCDRRKTNATSYSYGCVNHKYVPTMVFDSRIDPELLEPAVKHIYDSQKNLVPHWGVPSFENPLTRTEDSAKNTANRGVACPSSLTRPPGKQCDEFPFASTNEGAAKWGPDAINVDWSRRFIDEDSNLAGGEIIKDFYIDQRVREGDKFWVKSILPDGTASW